MALWRYTLRYPDGRSEDNVLAAGNQTAARERAERNAAAKGARVASGPELVDPVRGSM
jgi:hypothetical protein